MPSKDRAREMVHYPLAEFGQALNEGYLEALDIPAHANGNPVILARGYAGRLVALDPEAAEMLYKSGRLEGWTPDA